MKLHESGEDYLETILILENRKGIVRSIDVAEYLGYTKPSVSVAMRNLREGGFLEMDADHFIRLTEAGRAIAEKIYERHQFFTSGLVQLGVEPEQAEREACKIEHDISDETFERLKAYYAESVQTEASEISAGKEQAQ